MRRTGDTVFIPADYQHVASQKGNAVQRFWHGNKKRAISHFLPPEKGDFVLDVGCGSGVVSDFLHGMGAEVLGIDGRADAIEFAKTQYQGKGIQFQKGYVDSEFHLERPVDKIYCLEVIEHIYQEQGVAMLRSFQKVLRPGGKVFLTTPNYRSLWPVIEWAMDKLALAPQMADDQHVTKYHSHTLNEVVKKAGLNPLQIVSHNLIAPWLAPFSWRLAELVSELEHRGKFSMGSIIIAILEKPAAT